MRDLYPNIEPYDHGRLDVGDGHNLYYEQCGNPEGKPVVIIHGGPGGGCNADMRRFHDPDKYRMVLFDQRGAGRSTPHASLHANTTWHLVADIERIRNHLGIDRWQVFGGSWGSTLALAYAQTHPEQVMELVLRGIFMLRRMELEFFYQEGASYVFPDAFESYKNHIPAGERNDFISAYYRRVTSDDEQVRQAAAREWTLWEGRTSKLLPNKDLIASYGEDKFSLAFARIESHYFVHGGFFEVDDQLLRGAHKLKDIPCVIVHGRYDVVCPIVNAWDLKKAYPTAELIIVDEAGHSAFEKGNASALVEATDRFSTAL